MIYSLRRYIQDRIFIKFYLQVYALHNTDETQKIEEIGHTCTKHTCTHTCTHAHEIIDRFLF